MVYKSIVILKNNKIIDYIYSNNLNAYTSYLSQLPQYFMDEFDLDGLDHVRIGTADSYAVYLDRDNNTIATSNNETFYCLREGSEKQYISQYTSNQFEQMVSSALQLGNG